MTTSQHSAASLTALRLFLQKCAGDFSRENRELQEWIQDRALHIESLGIVTAQQNKSPDAQTIAHTVLVETAQDLSAAQRKLLTTVTQEEFAVIMAKMIRVLELPPGKLEKESALYLEQQLSDLLGFEVLSEFADKALSYATGTMIAGQHLKRTPTDTLQDHGAHYEAGLHPNRGNFGWFSHSSSLASDAVMAEKYYVSLPLYTDIQWMQDQQALKQWYAFRKVLIVNPNEHQAVVAKVGSITPPLQTKFQFVGSPEVIREGKIWSPKAKGRVFVFFIEDPDNTVALGPIKLAQEVLQDS